VDKGVIGAIGAAGEHDHNLFGLHPMGLGSRRPSGSEGNHGHAAIPD